MHHGQLQSTQAFFSPPGRDIQKTLQAAGYRFTFFFLDLDPSSFGPQWIQANSASFPLQLSMSTMSIIQINLLIPSCSHKIVQK